MNIEDLQEEIFRQEVQIKIENKRASHILLSRTLYEEIRRENGLRGEFVHKYEQRDTIKGDTLMGLSICVSEQSRRLCKVVAV